MPLLDVPKEITPPWTLDKAGLVIQYKPRTKIWMVFYLSVRQSKGRQPFFERSGRTVEEALGKLREAIKDGVF